MPWGLKRYQEAGQTHFVTFSCYRRQPNFTDGAVYDLFLVTLEAIRRRFAGCPRFASLFWTLTWDHCTRGREGCKFLPRQPGAPQPALSLSKGSPFFWANLG